MGAKISKLTLVAFELANELFIAVGSGLVGIVILSYHGFHTNHNLRTVVVGSVTAASLYYVFHAPGKATASLAKVVLVTGCDSGLGYSLASHLCEAGFTVWAGCLSLESHGADKLAKLYPDQINLLPLDVTDTCSVEAIVDRLENFLTHNLDYELWAVVNNAGVMVFGEFEWYTEKIVNHHIDVNLLGTMRFTKALCPLLRQYKARLVTVTSHCASEVLPGLSVYGATKAGLSGWCDGLRVELAKFGVNVVKFVPGSFVTQSNILEAQVERSFEMCAMLSAEQSAVYGEYFRRYNAYLSTFCGKRLPVKVDDPGLYEAFDRALLDVEPRSVYVNEPLRYKVYHCLFRWCPVTVRDYLVTKFMMMPEYDRGEIFDDASPFHD